LLIWYSHKRDEVTGGRRL